MAELLLPVDQAIAITVVLNRLSMVEWDRASGTEEWLGVFGWISRPDGGRDFVDVIFTDGVPSQFGTSSAEHSESIDRLLWPDLDAEGHLPCIPVPDLFPAVNRVVEWQQPLNRIEERS